MSQNKTGENKKFPQRKPYQTYHSPYRLSGPSASEPQPDDALPLSKASSGPKALRFPRLRRSKRKAEVTGVQRDVDPKKRYLKDRLSDEIVLKIYRRSRWHIFYLSTIPAILTVFTIVSFLFSAFLPVLNLVAIPLIILTIGWWIWTVVDWENDYLIVTSKRFVKIEKLFLFEQSRDEIRSVDFTEVKLEAKRGSLEYAFQIGTVIIQGKSGTIIFNRLPKPDKVYQEIDNDYKERRKSRRKERDEYMDKYFMARAGNKPPEAPSSMPVIPYIKADASIFKKVTSGLPVLSLDENRRQQLIWHKHPFILLKAELMYLVLSIVYLIVLLIGIPILIGIGGLIVLLGAVVAIFLAAILMAIMLYKFDEWQNNIYILNPEEVIDSEKLPFGFNEFKDRIKLVNVQEIQLNKPGFFSNIFNFGSVQVSRIGSNKPLTFSNIPNPDAVQMQIGRWKDVRMEIAESMEDQRIVDFLVRHRHNLHHLIEEE